MYDSNLLIQFRITKFDAIWRCLLEKVNLLLFSREAGIVCLIDRFFTIIIILVLADC